MISFANKILWRKSSPNSFMSIPQLNHFKNLLNLLLQTLKTNPKYKKPTLQLNKLNITTKLKLTPLATIVLKIKNTKRLINKTLIISKKYPLFHLMILINKSTWTISHKLSNSNHLLHFITVQQINIPQT